MQNFVFIACLLASLAAATPVQLERRQFGMGGGIGGLAYSSSQHQDSSAASSTSSNVIVSGLAGMGGSDGMGFSGANLGIGGGMDGGMGLGMGGMGAGMGFGLAGGAGGMSSSFNSQSASSYISSSAINSFSGLGNQIAAMQNMMAGGSMTLTIAMQQMSQLAASMQGALSLSAGCGCFGHQGFVSTAHSAFSQFYSLMMSMQSMFGGSFGQILQPFAQLGSSFQSFAQSFSSSGYSMSSIIPSNFPSLLGHVIPGMPTMMGFK